MRRNITPLLSVEEGGEKSPSKAYKLIMDDEEVTVSSDGIARVVLIRLGLTSQEAKNRIELSYGEGPYS